MNINWKKLATPPGFKGLRSAAAFHETLLNLQLSAAIAFELLRLGPNKNRRQCHVNTARGRLRMPTMTSTRIPS